MSGEEGGRQAGEGEIGGAGRESEELGGHHITSRPARALGKAEAVFFPPDSAQRVCCHQVACSPEPQRG